MKKENLLRISIWMLFLIFSTNQSVADIIQEKDTVSGIVVDKKNQPMPGAKVEIVGLPYSVYTDFDGRFNIICETGAKKVRVTYPKFRPTEQKIKPDMTVRIGNRGRRWSPAPENYQWFAGANIGLGATSTSFDLPETSIYGADVYDDSFIYPNISIVVGRVKTIGWFAKAFINPSMGMIDDKEDSEYPDNRCFNSGLIVGGMVRLGCPIYLCLGGGFAYTNLSAIPKTAYSHYSWQANLGYLFRIKNHWGINMDWNLGKNKDLPIVGSALNLGVSYFFNK